MPTEKEFEELRCDIAELKAKVGEIHTAVALMQATIIKPGDGVTCVIHERRIGDLEVFRETITAWRETTNRKLAQAVGIVTVLVYAAQWIVPMIIRSLS